MTKLAKSIIADILPLTPMQEGMLFHYLKEPGGDAYVEQLSLELNGGIDKELFEKAWNEVVRVNQMTRACFRWQGVENPVQIILKEHKVKPVYHDWSGLTADEAAQRLRIFKNEDRRRSFDLTAVPFRLALCTMKPGHYVLIVSHHHILLDGWSTGILLGEFFDAYAALSLGQMPAFPPKTPFKEYIKWLSRRDKTVEERYWHEYLEGYEAGARLAPSTPSTTPTDKEERAAPPCRSLVQVLETPIVAELTTSASTSKITPAVLLYAAWGLLLRRYVNHEDIVFGAALSGRDANVKGIRDMAGLFINTLPLRVDARPGDTLSQVAARIDRALNERRTVENTPLADVISYSGINGGDDLFDTLLVIENYPLDRKLARPGADLTIRSYSMTEATHYSLTIGITLTESIEIKAVYRDSLFEEEFIQRLIDHFSNILTQVTRFPDRQLNAVQMISAAERQRLLFDFNRPPIDVPAHKTIHGLVEEQALKTPDAVAIVEHINNENRSNRSDRSDRSYEELRNDSQNLAQSLREQGIGAGHMVAVKMYNGIELITALLAILKAGAAYLPIDPSYPQDRIDYMLKDSSAVTLLLHRPSSAEKGIAGSNSMLAQNGAVSLNGRRDAHQADTRPNKSLSQDQELTSYIIYTSGTTGRPKGVAVGHRGFVNLIYAHRKIFDEGPGTRMSQVASPAFDAMAFEVWPCLSAGGTLYIADNDTRIDGERMKQWLMENDIEITFQPTAAAEYLMTRAWPVKGLPLRALRTAGDRLARRPLPACPFKVYNLYGPTEDTVWTTWTEVEPQTPANSHNYPVIGKPVDNHAVYILSIDGELQPSGLPGEICIGGAGLAYGYLNRPELTDQRFLYHTLKSNELGCVLYRTGDIGRWTDTGDIEFIGRNDQQVKIRGYRIELGEIQRCLLNRDDIREAVVVNHLRKSGEKYLCAYVVLETPDTKVPDKSLDLNYLRDYLKNLLPDYMIPAYFMALPQLPVTASGKIHRRALPRPASAPVSAPSLPATKLEKTVAAAWQEVLDLERVGVHENIFDVGGNSLNIMRISQKLKKKLDRDVPVVTLFRFPTIHSLARRLAEGEQEQPAASNTGQKAAKAAGPDSGGVAVIGMAGRFPGARNIGEFLQNLENGIETISFFTKPELEEEGIEARTLEDPAYVGAYGWLEDAHCFDASFFDYTPMEAGLMDPQMRVFHETAWQALEDAAIDVYRYDGDIGVYAGASSGFYWQLYAYFFGAAAEMGAFAAANLADANFLVTRLAYALNLRGPANIVQTACSTGLVAIHQAYRAIQAGDCDMALAGGVSIPGWKKQGYLYNEGLIYSPDGHCRAFDADAGGTVGGSGSAAVVLKPLEQAIRDRDHIYAVIKGSASNNDGHQKAGYTAPGIEGQATVIRAALAEANAVPDSIGYIETHGTGTALGDPVEVEGLKLAFNTAGKKSKTNYCAIGSVKTNFGHLDAAAGAAGFIKAVLSVYRGVLMPTVHFHSPNPGLGLDDSPFYVSRELKPWPGDNGPRRAGISSFGIGGTNAHVIIEQAPLLPLQPVPKQTQRPYHLITLSAKTQTALDAITQNLASHLISPSYNNHSTQPIHPGSDMCDIAFTLHVGRSHFPYRRILVTPDSEHAATVLSDPRSEALKSFHARPETATVVFMFPGYGAQYQNMGLELYRTEPVFRREIDRCFSLLRPILGKDIKALLYPRTGLKPPSPGDPVNLIENAQPILFIFEYALARLLMAWGVRPDVLMGYSLGEYTAAALSGVLALQDALRMVTLRGKLMHQTSPGAMLSVALAKEELLPLLEDNLELALECSSDLCVVAGESGDIDTLENRLKDMEVETSRLRSSHGYHSRLMEPILEQFQAEVSRFQLKPPRIPLVSNLTAELISDDRTMDAGYWTRHIRDTVRFSEGLSKLFQEENAILVEVGPGKTLMSYARRHSARTGRHLLVQTVRHPKDPGADAAFLLEGLGRLWTYGCPIDWKAYHKGFSARKVSLPGYPFNKKSFRVQGDPVEIMKRALAGKSFPAMELPRSMTEEEKESLTGQTGRDTERSLATAYSPAESETEKALAGLWQAFFGIARIGVNDDFFELGGDSLKAVTLNTRMSKHFGLKAPLAEFFARPTVRKMSLFIDEQASARKENSDQSIPAVEEKDYYPMSSTQKRLYLIQHMDEGSTAYNIPMVTAGRGQGEKDRIEKDRIENVLTELIRRHESLRTSFHMIDGEPVQRIHASVPFDVETYDREGEPAEIISRFIRPFDLSQAPLLRSAYIQMPDGDYLWLLDIHHIVTDGTSQGILLEEFNALIQGKTLEPVGKRYRDYCSWTSGPPRARMLEQQRSWWLDVHKGVLPVLQLPTDYARPEMQSAEGDAVIFSLDEEECLALTALAKTSDATLYMVLLAVYTVFLAKLSGQDDIIVGTPVASRRHEELSRVVGMFVNTLALRNFPTAEKSFAHYLKEVKERTVQAFDNQEYPFEELVEAVSVKRDASRNPLFDVMFNLWSGNEETLRQWREASSHLDRYGLRSSKFDLNLGAFDSGSGLTFELEYSTRLFKPQTIRSFIRYFKNLLNSAAADKTISISQMELLSPEGKQEILEFSNGVDLDYDRTLTIHSMFQRQAALTPHRIAVTGVQKSYKAQITYAQLDRQSSQLALRLREQGAGPGSVIAIRIPRSIDLITGILAILKSGAAYLPLDTAYPRERVDYMLKDSGALFCLEELKDFYHGGHGGHGEKKTLLECRNDDPLYVIYTSGSTGKPKGVVLEHRNLVNLIHFQYRHTSIDFSRVLQFTTISFDVSFQEIFSTLLAGGQLFLIDEETRNDITALFAQVEAQVIHTLFLPTAFLKFIANDRGFVKYIPETVRHLVVAGEQLVIAKGLRRALREKNILLHNHYGPSETHVVTTLTLFPDGDLPQLPSIGRPVSNTQMLILDPQMNLQPPGVPGQLLISGIQTGRGYLNRPELTSEKFLPIKSFAGSRGGFSKEPLFVSNMYVTGDLARWLPDGNIEFLGRMDHQVKVRGFRIEPGEIENLLLDHPGINEAVVKPFTGQSGETYLCAYLVPGQEKDLSTQGEWVKVMRRYLSQSLPDYMVPSYFVPMKQIPLTPNRKIDRAALAEPETASNENEKAPVSETEKTLAKIWNRVLGCGEDAPLPGIHRDFFEMGGHSLKAMAMVAGIENRFNVKIPLSDVFKHSTIHALARLIDASERDGKAEINAVEKREYYPLSSAQRRLYVQQHLSVGGVEYNLPVLFSVEGKLDIPRMEDIFRRLIQRHQALRTSFIQVEGQPVQRVHEDVPFSIGTLEQIGASGPVARAFDLSIPPLFRVEAGRGLLMLDMHHIVSDGVSMGILVREFMELYNGKILPKILPVPYFNYTDYAMWQHENRRTAALKNQETYWLDQFSDQVPVLSLETDFPRPQVRDFQGRNIPFHLDTACTSALKNLATEEGATLFMVILAAFNLLLSRLSNKEDIVMGTPEAGREALAGEPVMGMCVNTLALRNRPNGEKTFVRFLAEVKSVTLAAFENSQYQYEELVEKLGIQEAGRNPLFDVVFSMHDYPIPEIEIPGVRLEPVHLEHHISKFDLTLAGKETNEGIAFSFEYDSALFQESTILRYIDYFKRILAVISEMPGLKLRDIQMLGEAERQRLLFQLNDTEAAYPKEKSVHMLFEEQVARTPDYIALISEKGTGANKTCMSYCELNRRAGLLAAELREDGVIHGDIVAVKIGRSLEMIVTLLGILKAGAAYMPIDPGYPQDRIDYMLKDSAASTVLINRSSSLEKVSRHRKPNRPNIPNVVPNVVPNVACPQNPDSLCYVIYTSGTTGKPKGSLITHRNVVRLMINHRNPFDFSSDDIWTMFHSYCFDFSVWEMYGALLFGGKLIIVSRQTTKDPRAFLKVLTAEQVTVLNQTPPAFYNLARIETAEPLKRLNLKYVIFGGDALKPLKLKEFQQKYPDTRLVNMFGITETTVHVTIKHLERQDIDSNISNIGGPIPTLSLYVMDSYGRLTPAGVPGELCVGGAGVCRGYLNRPELTAEKFVDNPYKPGQRLYKSGDLGKITSSGDIEYLGRIDHQVKIRGFRIELGEIENRLLAHPYIREAVVSAKSRAGDHRFLCAYIVPSNTALIEKGVDGLSGFLSRSLPDYMVPAYFMTLAEFPLTSNGKLDRAALPEPGLISSRTYTAPRNAMEKTIVSIWAGILKLDSGRIGIDDSFFDLGGDSLSATVVTTRLHKECGMDLPLAQFFRTPTVRELADSLARASNRAYAEIPPVEDRAFYPLSPAQKRLFILQQLEPKGTGYNMPYTIPLQKGVRLEKLESVFDELIARHESLRTSFHLIDDEPVQAVHPVIAPIGPIGPVELNTKPFDMSKAPLMRVGVVTGQSGGRVLLVDMHHIISDGASQQILEREFAALMRDEALEPLPLRYRDYAVWWHREEQQRRTLSQRQYWLSQFSGELPVLQLPYDFPRPQMQSFEGDVVMSRLDAHETGILKNIAAQHGATLYMVVLSVFNILLARLSNQEDIVVGTPVAARRHAGLESIVGMFVNTLAMRNYPEAAKTFNQFLSQVKERTLEAFDNQEYPFEELVENVSAPRDTSRNPLFDVMFNLLNRTGGYGAGIVDGERLNDLPSRNLTAKFDLNLTAREEGEELIISLEYSTRLFLVQTVERFIGYFKRLIHQLGSEENRQRAIGGLNILSREESAALWAMSHGKDEKYGGAVTIHEWFEAQAAATPDHIALIWNDIQISYDRLNRDANRLAGNLRSQGVSRGCVVAIKMKRSVQLITGLLGILKAGAAYLPVDPAYPGERIEYMLKDSGALLCLEELDDFYHGGHGGHGVKASLEGRSDDPLYVIYTSGSTGKPKGVMLEHRNLVNLMHYQYRHTDIDFSRVLQFTTISFDVSFQEVFSTLLSGGSLVLIDESVRDDVPEMFRVIQRERIKTLFLPASYLKFILGEQMYVSLLPLCVEHIVSAGEQIIINQAFREYLQDRRVYLHNHYGPSETHVVTALTLDPSRDLPEIPAIGSPVSNTAIYIVNKTMSLQPLGVPGELLIGGIQTGRGYLNKPELTATKFLSIKSVAGSRGGFSKEPLAALGIYKTGDLAKWLPDGNIEFLGRIDHQVKIRGFRVELGEIESRLLEYAGVRECVVIHRMDDRGDGFICAYFAGEADTKDLRAHLSACLPDYMVPSVFMQLDAIPLTPNRKIDRRALPEPDIAAGKTYSPPRNQVERSMVKVWAEVLSLDESVIGIDDDFFMLGGHSLRATVMASKLKRVLHVDIPLAQIFKTPVIRRLSSAVEQCAKSGHRSVQAVEQREYYPLSPAQKRMYVLQQMDLQSTAYNMIQLVPLDDQMELEKVAQVFVHLIARHESLRTSFHLLDDEPVQVVHDEIGPIESIGPIELEMRSFDLSKAPLLRVGVVKDGSGGSVLLVDMHHIISDGLSQNILTREFSALYSGQDLPAPGLQYKDYAVWRGAPETMRAIDGQRRYWLDLLSGELPILDLPLDFQRPRLRNSEGGSMQFSLDESLTYALLDSAPANGMTPFMVMFSAYSILLARLSNAEDVITGVPVAGRRHEDLEHIIGMFVNTLPVRTAPQADITLGTYCSQVRDATLSAFENQEYPFEDLVELLNVPRDAGRHPVFSTVFNMLGSGEASGNVFTGEWDQPVQQDYNAMQRTAKFDLGLVASEPRPGQEMICFLEYRSALFKPETITRFAAYFKTILTMLTKSQEICIGDIDILTVTEKQAVLEDFNRTQVDISLDKTIHALFEEQVSRTPDHIALLGEDGTNRTNRTYLTYRELDHKACELADHLRWQGAGDGAILAIGLRDPIEAVIDILAALKAGAAYLPIDPAYPRERIDYMIEDSSAVTLLLHRPSLFDNAPRHGEPIGRYRSAASSLAYVIYTSGTTGRPKGVAVEHRNAVNTLLYRQAQYMMTPADVSLQLFSFAFDGFVTSFFTPLISGCRNILMDQGSVKDIQLIKEIIRERRVTHFIAVPALYRAVLEQLSRRDGVSLKLVTLAGDRLTHDLLNMSRQLHPHIEIAHEYGVTEGAVMSSIQRNQQAEQTISIGKPIWNTRIFILNSRLLPQPLGVAGELCIGGRGVARGYLNNPELTAERFIPIKNIHLGLETGTILESNEGPGEFPPSQTSSPYLLYRTGDLASWLEDGRIRFLGRMDHQVKVRGFRIELAEIENRLARHPEVKEVLVTIIDQDDSRSPCAYIVPVDGDCSLDAGHLREYLSQWLPAYMVPQSIVTLEAMPLTPNGKIDRKRLPLPAHSEEQAYAAPMNETQSVLVQMWQELLNLESPLGIDDNFFTLGGHSLKAAVLAARVHERFDVRLPLTELFNAPTIRALSGFILGASRQVHEELSPVEEKEYYPLTAAQKRLFILQQMETNSTAYNLPQRFTLPKGVSLERAESAFHTLITRHESLRTSFHLMDDEPVQVIHDRVEFSFGPIGPIGPIAPGVRPFDLSRAPLLRVEAYERPPGEVCLMLDMHHIITDGISQDILRKELNALLEGRELPDLAYQYKDYAQWQAGQGYQALIKKQETYWLSEFSGDLPILNLPFDFPRPLPRVPEGQRLQFYLDRSLTAALKEYGRKTGTTLYMNLLAGLNILSAKLSGQEDIIIGSPVAGRAHAASQEIIGMFVGTLAMRNFPLGTKTFSLFLQELKSRTLEAYDNQDYPFEQLVGRLNIERDAGRNPLFDVIFNFLETPEIGNEETLSESRLQNIHWLGDAPSTYDIGFQAMEVDGAVLFTVTYCSGLFLPKTIERFISYYKILLNGALADPGARLADIDILPEEEKHRLLVELNDTAAAYPQDKTIHSLFEEQAVRTPDHIALIGKNKTNRSNRTYRTYLSYKELNRRAGALAAKLKGEGVVRGDIVAVKTARDVEMIISLLGILKAGAAYLPIDPDYPQDRVDFMLNDTQAIVMLEHDGIKGASPRPGADIEDLPVRPAAEDFCYIIYNSGTTGKPIRDLPVRPAAEDFCYIIYTSGTTGKPKGILTRHRNVVAYISGSR